MPFLLRASSSKVTITAFMNSGKTRMSFLWQQHPRQYDCRPIFTWNWNYTPTTPLFIFHYSRCLTAFNRIIFGIFLFRKKAKGRRQQDAVRLQVTNTCSLHINSLHRLHSSQCIGHGHFRCQWKLSGWNC